MLYSVVICALTCMLLILAVLFVPKIKIGSWAVDLYWVVALAGAVAMVLAKQLDVDVIDSTLAADTVINPLKILVLFLSMTILSIYLDELGFFSYLADKTLEKTGASQLRLFVYLYCIVSLLTVSLQTTSSFFRLRLSSAILPRTHVSVLCLIWLPNLWPPTHGTWRLSSAILPISIWPPPTVSVSLPISRSWRCPLLRRVQWRFCCFN